MPKKFVFVAAAVVLFAVGVFAYERMRPAPQAPAAFAQNSLAHTVHIGGQTVRVMLATTPAEREQGLGGRAGLASDEGMLFVFPQDGVYAFWMKDMRFPIDIIWISALDEVVYVAEDVSPSTYPASYGPQIPARYVLELPAGFASTRGVRVGDIVGL